MKPISEEFVQAIPKTDLHVHLDGSLRLETLIELARAEGVDLPSETTDGLLETVFKPSYADLPEYLQGFAYTVAVMQRAEHIERIAYELAQDNLAEGVRYIEVRFAPQLHVNEHQSALDSVKAACHGLERAKQEHNRQEAVQRGHDIPFEYGVILCALRFIAPGMSDYYKGLFKSMSFAPPAAVSSMASMEVARMADLFRTDHGLPVVGFDLAGAEAGYPAVYHKAAFKFAHRTFLGATVHAGEAYGPESIFQAITDCYAQRIGHGTFLFSADQVTDPDVRDPERYVTDLAEYVARQRIPLEVCITSNLQTTPSIPDVSRHPLRRMLEANLSVSICTDNRLVSNTSVTRELLLAVHALDLTPYQLRNIVVGGFKGSFFPATYNEKRAYVRCAIDRYDALEQRMLTQS